MAEVKSDEVPRKTRDLFEKATAAVERNNLDYGITMLLAILDEEPRLLQARRLLRAAQIRRFRDKGSDNALGHALSTLKGVGGLIGATLEKNPPRALSKAERLMSIDPFNPPFYNRLAAAAEAADLPEVALHTLEMVRESNPDNIPLLRWLARLHQQMGQTAEARACLEHVVTLRPQDPQAIKALKDAQAEETMEQGRWTQATSYRYVMKDAGEAKRLEQQSKAVKTGSDLDALIEEMKGKVEAEPGNVNYQRALADYYARAEQFDEAEQVLEKALKQSGGGDPQIDRALSNIRVRRFDRAIAELREAGKSEEAAKVEEEKTAFIFSDAEDRVRRYPNDLQFKYEYGVLLFERDQVNEAIQQFQLSQRNPQRRVRSLYYLARCFAKKGQFDIAAEQLSRAVSELNLMDETKKDVVYELGLVYEQMKKPDKAMECFKEIYAVDIGYRDVAKRIEKGYPAGA